MAATADQPWELLLAGGEVLDPAAGLRGRQDIAVAGGRIAAVGHGLDRARAGRVIDLDGSVITPGIIDLHTHVLHGTTRNSAAPDEAGVRAGITTVVDAGSAGAATIGAFPAYIIPASRTEVIPFIHLAMTGLAVVPEFSHRGELDAAATQRAIEDGDGLIRGIKVRLVSPALETVGLDLIRIARDIASRTGVRLMVHFGDIAGRADPGVGARALDLLAPGDIVTHVFTANPGGVLDEQGRLRPQARAAAERGVIFDAAHGMRNLSFAVARRVLDHGLPLHSISSDMTSTGGHTIVFSLMEIMSRYFALGFDLSEIIRRVTSGPAAALGIADRSGRIAVGRIADLSVLGVKEGDWVVSDSFGEQLPLSRVIVPRLTVRQGETITVGPGPHSWGWTPAGREA